MGTKGRQPRPLPLACRAEMVFKSLAADRKRHVSLGRLTGEQHRVAVKVVPFGLVAELHRGPFDHAESVENRECRSELNVLVPALEARDGRRADLGNGG